jgi:hypothetical protein
MLSEMPASAGATVLAFGTPMPQQFQWPARALTQSDFYDALEALLEEQLDAHNVSYGILFPPSKPQSDSPQPSALVVTRHEYLRDDIVDASKVCQCTEEEEHMEYSCQRSLESERI